ncbi:MAG: GNAT family N-acetyltransferase [Candidatus Acidiferrales bacterium]
MMNAAAPQFGGTIRAARPEDCAQIAELSRQLGYPSTAQEIRNRMEGMKNSNEIAVFVAQMPDGTLAGWVGVFVSRTVEVDAHMEISGFVVGDVFRSHGIGKRLLERAEQWGREKGCKHAGVRSNVIRERAHAFYERNGYEHTKTQKSFRKNL